jgi:RNA 2',3'-cyclic 3'-phosphodiesterase
MATRLFTALKVPEELIKQARQLPLKGLDNARWSHVDDLHITLRFMGEVEDQKIDAVKELLGQIHVKPFTIVAKGLDVFDKKNRGVLYVPIESHKKITHLAAEITERLTRLDFVFPESYYTPHITLARAKNAQGMHRYAETHGKKIRVEWMATEFFLFRSADPDETGKRYTQLSSCPLRSF